MTLVYLGEATDSPELQEQTAEKTTIVRRFKVWSNDVNDGPVTVKNCAALPGLWSMYQFGNDGLVLFCLHNSRKAKRETYSPVGSLWIVEMQFQTPDTTEQQGQHENPLLELPEAHTSLESHSVPMQGYYVNNEYHAWRNSAGEIFEHPPEKDSSRLVLNISVNYPITFDAVGLCMQYKDTVNSDTFWGQPAGKAKMKSIDTQIKELKLPDDTYFEYLRLSFVIEFADEPGQSGNVGWDVQLVDYGSYYLDANQNKRKFLTDDGHERLGFLDGNGGDNGSAEPKYLPVRQRYNRVPFAPLGLPQSFAQCKSRLN